jgi:hypothetical protein
MAPSVPNRADTVLPRAQPSPHAAGDGGDAQRSAQNHLAKDWYCEKPESTSSAPACHFPPASQP